MALIALLTDTHIGARKGSKFIQDHFQKFYREVFFPTIRELNVDAVIHLGDAFDSRKTIDLQSLRWAKDEIFEPLSDFKVHMVVGNHDAYYKNTNLTNSPELILKDYSNIQTYSNPQQITISGEKILLLPWICEENRAKSLEMINKSNARFAMGHLELAGFYSHRGHTFEEDRTIISNDALAKFDKVFSGHFHTRSDNGKIYYIGNPYEMFWNDVDDPRGFVVFDTETQDIQYYNNSNTLFHIIYYEDINYKLFNASRYANKIVKVVVRKKSSQKDFDKFIDKLISVGVYDLKIVENFTITESGDFSVDDIEENTLSLLNRYIEDIDVDGDIDTDRIKSIISEVYKEACEV